MQPNNFAILTAAVRFSNDLTDRQKLLYAEITALSNMKGYCYATNNYIGQLYGRSSETISRDISALEKYGFVSIKLIRKKEGGTIRHIFPLMDSHTRLDEMVKPRLDETVKQNSINKNTINRERETDVFTEVMRYYRAKVNNRWEVSTNGKYRKRLSDLIHQGRAISDIKKVIDHRFAELERGDLPQYLVEPDNIFKADLFLKTLNAANFKPAQKPKAVNGKNSGIQLAGEEDFKDKPSGWENYGI